MESDHQVVSSWKAKLLSKRLSDSNSPKCSQPNSTPNPLKSSIIPARQKTLPRRPEGGTTTRFRDVRDANPVLYSSRGAKGSNPPSPTTLTIQIRHSYIQLILIHGLRFGRHIALQSLACPWEASRAAATRGRGPSQPLCPICEMVRGRQASKSAHA